MSEYNENNNYEPNFVLKPAKPVADENLTAEADTANAGNAFADAQVKSNTANAGDAFAQAQAKADVAQFLAEADAEADAEAKVKATADATIDEADAMNAEAKPAKRSAASEVLQAAAAKADALKAVAAKADPAGEPYRRETSELEDPIYAHMKDSDMSEAGNAAGEETSKASGIEGNGFIMRDSEPKVDEKADTSTVLRTESKADEKADAVVGAGSGPKADSSTDAKATSDQIRDFRFGQSQAAGAARKSESESASSFAAGSSSTFGSSHSGSSSFGGSTFGSSTFGSSTFGSAQSGAAQSGAAQSGARPRFENPSFDPGQTGHYTDPRVNFRTGESASWSNGEVHRNRRQMKETINTQKKQKRPAQPIMLTRKGLGLLVAGCLCLSCLFGMGGAALGMNMAKPDVTNSAQTTTAAAGKTDSSSVASNAGYTLEGATGSDMTIKEITNAARNSVVEIRTESVASDSWMQQYVTEGAGSGVIISEDGYIMTNNHVINGANKITVTTADEKEYTAKLIGTDENNDVAVIKINAKGLTPATYGDSDKLEAGDMAVAIGNPLGELGGTVTAGIISATDRELAIDGKTLHLLQTDSSINPGNSGGGLFNGSGQLVGLVVAKSAGSDVEGLGFAIPINTAADVAQQLIDKGYVSGQPNTGMTYQEGSSNAGGDQFSTFDSIFGGGGATGVFIYSVNGENAKKAGFQAGDQVYAVDGKEITDFKTLSSIITSHKVGDKVTFTIIRDGVQKNIKLVLEEKTAEDQAGAGQQGQNNQNGQQDQNGQNNQVPDQGQNDQVPDQGQNGQVPGGWEDFFNSFF